MASSNGTTTATPTDPTRPLPPTGAPVDLLGLLGSYRTGYVLLDTLLCILVPIAVQQLVTILQNGTETSLLGPVLAWLWAPRAGDDELVERTIEITQRFNRDGHKVWDYEQKNHLLQKAITLYLSEVVDLDTKDAKYELLEKPPAAAAKGMDDDASTTGSTTSSSEYDSEYDDDEDTGAYYGEVEKLRVEATPMINQWIEVEPGLRFKHEVITPENPGDHKGVSETKVVFRFQSKLATGSDRIDAFIERAYANYQEMERKKVKEDKSRYFYIQSGTTASQSDSNVQVVAYKRYALGEEKTFENLFFDEKEQVLQLLDNFTNKTGKFAIRGFPYKLGFLLHGPPGTGKTSLIKAIAQHTKRHIVTINLGKIKSNQELMDALFDLKFAVHGLDSPVTMSLEDVIFVMEDIDCASSIVNKRSQSEESNKKMGEDKLEGKSTGGKEKSDDEKLMSAMIKLVLEDEKKNSKLNLAGLLNVLDGVIDCPGRIIIMTTNHPEKLDPALIRPGRVNKKLLLTYMNWQQVQRMIEYYSTTTLSQDHKRQLKEIFGSATKQMTPAEVEEICAEYDTIDAIISALERISKQ